MTESLQVSQEGDLESHTFSQCSWLSRASSSANTVSMATRSDAWPLRWGLSWSRKRNVWDGRRERGTFFLLTSSSFNPSYLLVTPLISGKRDCPSGIYTLATTLLSTSPTGGHTSRDWEQNALTGWGAKWGPGLLGTVMLPCNLG